MKSTTTLDNIEYRKLKPSESADYRAIRLESLNEYPNSFGSTYEEQKQKNKLSFETFIEESNPECLIVGAWHHEKLIGICGFYRLTEKGSKHRGEIIQMYVQSKYQGRSIGYNLLRATVSNVFKISELRQIELEVISTAKRASKIYGKIGFNEYSVKKRFDNNKNTYSEHKLMVLFRNDMDFS